MRVSRPPAIALIVLALAAPAAAAVNVSVPTRTAETIVATWKCQDQLGHPRTRARSPWKPHSSGFRAAELNRWQQRREACTTTLRQRAATWRRLHDGISAYYRSQRRTSGPLSGHERAIEAAARRNNLSPYFLFAASITESSGGLHACHPNTMNIWGLASCREKWGHGKHATRVPTWPSWEAAFEWYARFLHGQTGISGGWPHATTTYDFHGYAECSSCWGTTTARHMAHYFGVDSSVRYGSG